MTKGSARLSNILMVVRRALHCRIKGQTKITGWAGFTHLWRDIFCFGGDEEINYFAQDFTVVLHQMQEPRGQISKFPATYPQPQKCFSELQLASTEYATLFLNFTSTSGYSGAHMRHKFGQDWVCRHATETPQQHCLLWPQPGHVSVNGKSPIGNLARVSVLNPKLAFVDDEIMAGQRCTTDFRVVDNISRLSHALDRIQVALQRWEHSRRVFFHMPVSTCFLFLSFTKWYVLLPAHCL